MSRLVFIASAGLLLLTASFSYGVVVGRYEIFPFGLIKSSQDAAQSLIRFGALVPQGRRVIARDYASRQRFTVHDPSRMLDGYYVFVGFDGERSRYSAWLHDSRGERLHAWSLDYAALDPDGPSRGSDSPHGFWALPDGSVIATFDDGDVMARLDACSEPVWIKPGIYHHLLERTDDGSFWVWRGDKTPYGHYHYMENFDAETGETVREIGLVEDVIERMKSPEMVFGVRRDFEFHRPDSIVIGQTDLDIFHPNDVEALPSSLAPAFPMFEAGDLLISVRRLNLVAVIDSDDYRVKWAAHGPWLSQHDPDFVADGSISVYSNNPGSDRRSEIIKIDPATRELSNDLSAGAIAFHSSWMGKHQYLPNGNVLIVVPGEGRVIESSPDGEYVMEFNNLSPAGREYNEHVENGQWVARDFFAAIPSCAG